MKTILFTIPFLCAVCMLAFRAYAAPAFKGMSYTTDFSQAGNDLGSPTAQQSLLKMSQMGADTVALNVWWFQNDVSSATVHEDDSRYSSTMNSVSNAIDYIHSLGMKVMLKPMLDVNDGTWRAFINPTDPDTWFGYNAGNPFVNSSSAPLAGSYGAFMNQFADLAQQKHVELFSIGCEMNTMEQYNANWQNLIANVRTHYSGPLTYSANWSSASGIGGYQSVDFWRQLDYVGIDAYFPLTISNNPSQTALRNGVSQNAFSIDQWRSTSGLTDKQVLFTETGFASYNGANRAPYAGPSGQSVDTQEQSQCYRALMSYMSDQPWFDGAFFWNWTSNPNDGGLADTNFTPQNKPAQQTLAEFYLLRGDFNLNHVLDPGDLTAMQTAIADNDVFKNAFFFSAADLSHLGDFTGDGLITAADLPGEMQLLGVPEPAAIYLAAASICALIIICCSLSPCGRGLG